MKDIAELQSRDDDDEYDRDEEEGDVALRDNERNVDLQVEQDLREHG